MLARRAVLGGLLLPVLLRPALALDSKAAITALNRPDLASDLGRSPERVVLGDWGNSAERLVACAILDQNDDSVMALLLRDGPDGRAEIVAGPGQIPAVKIDPFWTANAQIMRQTPLGAAPVVAIKLSNSYLSTSRSTTTEAVHFFLRQDKTLVPIFASLTMAGHSEGKLRWQRTWRITAEGRPNEAGVPPVLVVRDGRSGESVSRHRWRRSAYHPLIFDRTPPLGPG